MIAHRVLVAVLPLVLLGCGTGRARNQYVRTLDRQTEVARIYRGFSTALLMRGTYLSPQFRLSMAAERLRLLGPAADDPAAFLARMEDESALYWEVVFAAETPIGDRVPHFGESDDGWRLQLLADGIEQPLVSVYRVRDPNPLQASLFTFVNPWNELYIARFARTSEVPGELLLHVGSGFGHDTLAWRDEQIR